MDNPGILLTFSGGLAAALVLGYAAIKLKLSPIIGYLVAGIAVGPFTPGFVADRHVAEQFSEIGVILLLFGIGLRFHLKELLAAWTIVLPGALLQSFISTIIMAGTLKLLGWSWLSGIILGMAISVASTVVMALVLADKRDLHSPIGHISFGWTVVEDILTVVMLLLLPILFSPDVNMTASPVSALGFAALKIICLLIIVVLLGKWIIPWLLDRIEKTRSRELFTLAVLVLAVGIAVSSSLIFGVSMALGAFLAGLAVGRSDFAARAAYDAMPMRDAFAVLFFVSVGMLFDPGSLFENPLVILAVLGVVIIVKPVVAALLILIFRKPLSTAIPAGAAFSQIGEFSFILGTVARQLNLIDETGWNALIATSIISIALNPFIYNMAKKFSTRKKKPILSLHKSNQQIKHNSCILVGFGPVGKIVYNLLIDKGADVTIIDLNLDTIRELNESGKKALYGDIMRPGTLDEAKIASAGSLILSADIEDSAEIIRQARILNPKLKILARCSSLRNAAELKKSGADMVAAGEAEVGVAFAEALSVNEKTHSIEFSGTRDSIREQLYNSLTLTNNTTGVLDR